MDEDIVTDKDCDVIVNKKNDLANVEDDEKAEYDQDVGETENVQLH